MISEVVGIVLSIGFALAAVYGMWSLCDDSMKQTEKLEKQLAEARDRRRELECNPTDVVKYRVALIAIRDLIIKSKQEDTFMPDCPDDQRDAIGDFENALCELVCNATGEHAFVHDHCGKPEHDFCTCCERRREDIDRKND